MNYRVISIGALSQHELRPDKGSPRTAHATTVLIESDGRRILVDPGLPAPAIGARLTERAGIEPSDITDVFLTNFRPSHRRGLPSFDHARWLIGEQERESIGRFLVERFQQEQDEDVRQLLQADIAVMKRFEAAPDKLAPQVDLFPLPGFSPGTCGLLLTPQHASILIAGDAVATAEHLLQGKVLQGAFDIEQARESFVEAIEIADVIVPGHDNVILNPTKRRMM